MDGTATAGPTPAELQSALIDRLGRLVNQETRSAVHRQPDFKPNAEALRELSDQLAALFVAVELRADIGLNFVRGLQETHSAARDAMTDDFRSALRPDPDGELRYFQWGDDGDIEGLTDCDILMDGVAEHWHFQLAFASDSDGYGKAMLAGKPYKLKPKAVVKAWPELLARLGGTDDCGEPQPVVDATTVARRFTPPACPQCDAESRVASTEKSIRKLKCSDAGCGWTWQVPRAKGQ